MTQGPHETLRVSRDYPHPPETVFAAWLDPASVAQWLFTAPGGYIVKAEIEPRVGGHFLITDRRGDEDIEHTGEYFAIDPPHRLVFSFEVRKYSDAPTRVSVDITPQPDGCTLTLTHEHVLPEWVERTKDGWGKILKALAKALG